MPVALGSAAFPEDNCGQINGARTQGIAVFFDHQPVSYDLTPARGRLFAPTSMDTMEDVMLRIALASATLACATAQPASVNVVQRQLEAFNARRAESTREGEVPCSVEVGREALG